jgi:hypothetical protein
MGWSQPLPSPMILADGRHVGTLKEAAKLVLDCERPGRWNAHWRYAARLLMKAADQDASAADLEAFRRQLLFVLKAEELI